MFITALFLIESENNLMKFLFFLRLYLKDSCQSFTLRSFMVIYVYVCTYIKFTFSISSVQLLSHVQLFATPWTAACQASLSITNSQSLLKLMSIELVMPSNHLILYCPLLLLPSIFPSIRVIGNNESVLRIRWPKYWSFCFNISPSKDHPGLISFRMDWV